MNPYKRLKALLPDGRVDVGEVTAVYADGVDVLLLAGGTVRVRGAGQVGGRVYVREGAVEGPAPDLVGVEIEI